MEWFQFMLFVLACPMFSRKIHIFVVPFNAVDPEVASNKEGQRPRTPYLPLGRGVVDDSLLRTRWKGGERFLSMGLLLYLLTI